MKQRIKKAVFPVGGVGSRCFPVTRSVPKAMMPVLNKPLIHHAVQEAKAAGIEQFVFIVCSNQNAISDYFDRVLEQDFLFSGFRESDIAKCAVNPLQQCGYTVFINQRLPLGLGHAVLCARDVIGDDPFAVILADEIFISDNGQVGIMADLIKKFEASNPKENWVAISEINIEDSKKYGMVKLDGDRIIDMIEKPEVKDSPSNLAIVGRYILQPEIFYYLEKTTKGLGGEIHLTDAMYKMSKCAHLFNSYKISAERFDCGHYLGFLEANVRMAMLDQNFAECTKKMLNKFERQYKNLLATKH